jgi:CheY-like chemotaxis protein
LAKTCGDRVWQREFLDLAAACSSYARTRRAGEVERIAARAQRLASAAALVGQPTWAEAAQSVAAAVAQPLPEPGKQSPPVADTTPGSSSSSSAAGVSDPPVAAAGSGASPRDRTGGGVTTNRGATSSAPARTGAATEPLVARAAAQPLVLIVDSDPESRRVLQTYFGGAGFRVVALEDGGPALVKVREERPALVVADLLLPMVPGEVLILALRRSPATASIPIMVVTAEPWRLGPEHEVDVLLTKPVNVTVVVEAAKRLLGATVGTDPLQVSR